MCWKCMLRNVSVSRSKTVNSNRLSEFCIERARKKPLKCREASFLLIVLGLGFDASQFEIFANRIDAQDIMLHTYASTLRA